jgi:hypothetical protein
LGEVLGAEISKKNTNRETKTISSDRVPPFYTQKDETWHADEAPKSIKNERNI